MPWANAVAVTHLPGSVIAHDWLNSELEKEKKAKNWFVYNRPTKC